MEERPGVAFEPEELVGEFGGTRDAIRKTLDRLWRSGLVQFEERTKPNNNGKGGQTKYKVYLVTEFVQRLETNPSNGLVAGQSTTLSLDKLDVFNDKVEPVQRPNSSPVTIPVAGQNESRIPPSEKNSFKVGDRVLIVMAGSKYQGKTGTVRRVFTEHGRTVVTVQPDGSRQRVDYRTEYLKSTV